MKEEKELTQNGRENIPSKAPKSTVKENRDKETPRSGRKEDNNKKFQLWKTDRVVSDLEDLKLHQKPLAKLTVERTNHPNFYLESFKVLEIPRAACTSGNGMR